MLWKTLMLAAALLGPAALAARREPAPSPARAAAGKGLAFIQADDARWRAMKDICSSCHHGVMSVVTYSEARRAGLLIDDRVFTDTLAWTKARFVPPFETTPNLQNGFEIPSLAIPLLTLALSSQPEILSPTDLDRMTKHLLDRQLPDGGWALQPRNPHPVMESREIVTTWFYLGLEPAAALDNQRAAAVRDSRDRARKWLDSRPPADTTQSVVLRLLVAVHNKAAAPERERAVAALLKRQNADGGWGQIPELASDAYATGQALYALSLAGVSNTRPEVRRGVDFLVSTQQPDGSWKMVPRATPERPASKNLVPITFFGAAWGTIGLLRSLPEAG